VFFNLGLSSIMKNYQIHESLKIELFSSIQNMDKLRVMSNFIPSDDDNFQSMDNYLSNIHIDFSDDDKEFFIHELKSSSIIELRGETFVVDLTLLEFNYLLVDATANIDDNSALLKILYDKYRIYIQSHPRSFRNNFIGYIQYFLTNNFEELTLLDRENDEIFKKDLNELTTIIEDLVIEEKFILT
jgi:hypothetical protein